MEYQLAGTALTGIAGSQSLGRHSLACFSRRKSPGGGGNFCLMLVAAEIFVFC